jgi:hypothetical protein
MPDFKDRRWAWSAIATAAGIIGLGNGVWFYVTQPLIVTASQWLISVFSLGVESYKDNVYAAAGRGMPEAVATHILGYVVAILAVWPLVFYITARNAIAKLSNHDSAPPLMVRIITGDPRTTSRARMIRRISLATYITIVATIFGVGYSLTAAASVVVSNVAVAYYRQIRTIVAPHVPPQVVLEYDARMVRVTTRQQYFNLLKEMDTEARKHTADVPDFSVW